MIYFLSIATFGPVSGGCMNIITILGPAMI